MDFASEYRSKQCTPEEAVKVVKSGDWVDYTSNVLFPNASGCGFGAAQRGADRRQIRGNLLFGPIKTVECDPAREHFHL